MNYKNSLGKKKVKWIFLWHRACIKNSAKMTWLILEIALTQIKLWRKIEIVLHLLNKVSVIFFWIIMLLTLVRILSVLGLFLPNIKIPPNDMATARALFTKNKLWRKKEIVSFWNNYTYLKAIMWTLCNKIRPTMLFLHYFQIISAKWNGFCARLA